MKLHDILRSAAAALSIVALGNPTITSSRSHPPYILPSALFSSPPIL